LKNRGKSHEKDWDLMHKANRKLCRFECQGGIFSVTCGDPAGMIGHELRAANSASAGWQIR